MKVFILLGPPGSGKGTLSKILKQQFNVTHVSTGDLLRHEVQLGTDLGKTIKDNIEKGLLVNDSVILSILYNRLLLPDCNNGFIIDGLPRTYKQAVELDGLLLEKGITRYDVIRLNIDEDILIRRITGRFVCESCNAIYNEYYHNTKIEGICDICSSDKLSKRDDDNLEVLNRRLAVYRDEIKNIASFYQQKRYLLEIDATLKLDEMESTVKQLLQK